MKVLVKVGIPTEFDVRSYNTDLSFCCFLPYELFPIFSIKTKNYVRINYKDIYINVLALPVTKGNERNDGSLSLLPYVWITATIFFQLKMAESLNECLDIVPIDNFNIEEVEAKEIHIARISNQNYYINDKIEDGCFQRFFCISRYVHEGIVLPIGLLESDISNNHDESESKHPSLNDHVTSELNIIWYKVLKVTDNGSEKHSSQNNNDPVYFTLASKNTTKIVLHSNTVVSMLPNITLSLRLTIHDMILTNQYLLQSLFQSSLGTIEKRKDFGIISHPLTILPCSNLKMPFKLILNQSTRINSSKYSDTTTTTITSNNYTNNNYNIINNSSLIKEDENSYNIKIVSNIKMLPDPNRHSLSVVCHHLALFFSYAPALSQNIILKPLRLSLLSSLLIECSQSEDTLNVLQLAANHLGIKFYEIQTKDLLTASAATVSPSLRYSTAAPSLSIPTGYAAATPSVGDWFTTCLNQRPCLFYLSLYHASTSSTAAGTSNEELQSQLSSAIDWFLNQLDQHEQLFRGHHREEVKCHHRSPYNTTRSSPRSTTGLVAEGGKDGYAACHHRMVLVAGCHSPSKLQSSLCSLFPSSLRLPKAAAGIDDVVVDFTPVAESVMNELQISPEHRNPNTATTSTTITTGACPCPHRITLSEEALESICQAAGSTTSAAAVTGSTGSVSASKGLARECALTCLQSHYAARWLEEFGLGELLPFVNTSQTSPSPLLAHTATAPTTPIPTTTTTTHTPILAITAPDIKHTLSGLSEPSQASLHPHSSSPAAVSVTPVRWEDIGGLDRQRDEILDVLMLPRKYPQVFRNGCQRRGVLLYGPPGTGKTLVAKAVATECKMNFISIKGPELLDIYVGESEKNVREVFAAARAASPAVLFFDELDSLAPARGRGNDGGGVMDRLVSMLLAEMDRLNSSSSSSGGSTGSEPPIGEVFVIGATNRPDLLDAAMLRPGRFDRLVYLGPTQDIPARINILQAQTRKFNLEQRISFDRIARQLVTPCTGADIGSVASNAFSMAMERSLANLQKMNKKKTKNRNISNNKSVTFTSKKNQAYRDFDHLYESDSRDDYNDDDIHDGESKDGDDDSDDEEEEGDTFELVDFLNSLSENDPLLQIVVTEIDLLAAAKMMKPSLTLAEVAHYEKLGETFDSTLGVGSERKSTSSSSSQLLPEINKVELFV